MDFVSGSTLGVGFGRGREFRDLEATLNEQRAMRVTREQSHVAFSCESCDLT